MNRQIRRGVFETNSSSVHSITMCSDDEYKRWENGEAYMPRYGSQIKTREEIIKELQEKKHWKTDELYYPNVDWDNKDSVDELIEDNEYKTYSAYWDDIDFETFDDSYTTPNGEKVHAFGYYGMDN